MVLAQLDDMKAEDIVTHAREIFFSEEEIKKSARRF